MQHSARADWSRYSRPAKQTTNTIHYVNALPGAGKTHTFVHVIAKTHVERKHGSVLVYSAPTDKLLDEVEQALTVEAGIDPDKVYRISSRDESSRVSDRFLAALSGSKEYGIKPIPNGSILLCTHECLARIPPGAQGRERVVLIYDEARACLQDTYSLSLPEAVYLYLTGRTERTDGRWPLILETPVYHDDKGDIFLWTWGSYSKPMVKAETIADLLPDNTRRNSHTERILEFIDNVRSSSIDVFVSVRKQTLKNQVTYIVNNVFSPGRMFLGYNRVLILGAFFKSSQMYHFLSEGLQRDILPPTLMDMTKHYIDYKRLRELAKRLSSTYITWVLPDRSKELTKTEMQHGLVINAKLTKEDMQTLNGEWCKLFGKRAESYRSAFEFYQTNSTSQRFSLKARDKSTVFFEDMTEQGYSMMSVTQYMVRESVRLYHGFCKAKGVEPTTLPVGINPRYSSSSTQGSTVWEAENLDQLNRTANYTVKNGPIITPLRMVSHGLNAYRNLNACAFLASMKYSPQEYEFLKRSIPKYDPTMDRTLDYAIQVLWRCSVRNTDKGDEPCLLIVTDQVLAERLRERFLNYLPPSLHHKCLLLMGPHLFASRKAAHVMVYSEPYNSEDRKTRNTEYRNSKEGKANQKLQAEYNQQTGYSKLTSQISYYRKVGPDHMVDKLLEQRSKLPKFSEWRKTEAGMKAEASLVNSSRPLREQNKAKVLTAISNPSFWPDQRSARLAIILALKALGIKQSQVTTYPGDGLSKNWNTKRVWEKGSPASYILTIAKNRGVGF